MTITKYKTPDTAIFGLNSERERVFFGDVRKVQDNKELINLVKIRNQIFFIDQVQVLDDNKCAFPLMHMTIFGIKNLTKLLNGTNDVSQEEVCKVLEQMNPLFLEKVDLTKYVNFWDDRVWDFNDNLSYVFYNLAFTDLKKGYSLDYGEDVTLVEWEDIYFRLNPGWLWNSYRNYAEKVFDNLSETEESLTSNYIREELLK